MNLASFSELLNSVTISAETLQRVLLQTWFRFFGCPHYMVVDQGGAFSGFEMASLCDRYRIERILAGSENVRSGLSKAKHTSTALAEKHIHLLKSTMLKLHADCVESGDSVSREELVAEACLAHNALLTFNGVTPSVGVLGNAPRDLYELENTSPDAIPRPAGVAGF